MIRAAALAADSFYCLDEMKSDPIKAICNLDISWVETSYEEVKPPVVCFFTVSYNPSSPWWVLLGILQRCNTALSSESIPAVVAFLVNLKIFFDFEKKKKVKAVSCTLCRLLIILHNPYSQSKQ